MPKIVGAHSIIYSRNAEADREFLRDAVGLPHVDVGEGWLIFALPPAEVAVHPSDKNNVHEFYLMVGNLREFIKSMAARGVRCTPQRDLGWGVLTEVSLPGGGRLGVYEPRHARPGWPRKRPGGAKARGTTPRKSSRPAGRGRRRKAPGSA